MEIIRNIVDDIIYVGASDKRLGLFENLFPIPNGVSYNSYLINDKHTCLMDTCDASVSKQFIENLKAALNGRELDYLVVNHMEPDHAALISDVVRLYPDVCFSPVPIKGKYSFFPITPFVESNDVLLYNSLISNDLP